MGYMEKPEEGENVYGSTARCYKPFQGIRPAKMYPRNPEGHLTQFTASRESDK